MQRFGFCLRSPCRTTQFNHSFDSERGCMGEIRANKNTMKLGKSGRQTHYPESTAWKHQRPAYTAPVLNSLHLPPTRVFQQHSTGTLRREQNCIGICITRSKWVSDVESGRKCSELFWRENQDRRSMYLNQLFSLELSQYPRYRLSGSPGEVSKLLVRKGHREAHFVFIRRA